MDSPAEVKELYQAIKDQQYEAVLDILAQHKINLNAPIYSPLQELSTLATAARFGNKDICQALLDAGADVDFGSRSGLAPLYLAARRGNMDIVKHLVERGANINIRHMTGNTPLLEAVAKGHGPMVPYLLDAGADPHVTNNAGETGLHLAGITGNIEHIKLFLKAGVDVNMGRVSSVSKRWERKLKQSQLPPAESECEGGKSDLVYGNTPLHLAIYGAQQCHYTVAKLLIENGANVNACLPNGRTALHFAALRNAVEMAELLISHGCEVDPVSTDNDEHKTPLLKAVDAGHLAMVETLINAGADIDFQDHWGCTPLLSAIFSGKVEIALYLVRAGCDINMASKGGFTPFRASLRHPPHMTQMLVLAGCKLGPEVMVMLDEPLNNKLYDTYLDIREWVINMLNSPKALQQMCRETTRKHLPVIHKLGKLESLPIPQRIVKYLNLSDVEEILSFYHGLDSGGLTMQEVSVGI